MTYTCLGCAYDYDIDVSYSSNGQFEYDPPMCPTCGTEPDVALLVAQYENEQSERKISEAADRAEANEYYSRMSSN